VQKNDQKYDELDLILRRVNLFPFFLFEKLNSTKIPKNMKHFKKEIKNRRYTCDECIQGLEWVEAYLEDPIMIAEFRIYLEQNFCLSDWDDCKQLVEEHFTGMHTMAMEKFFIPTGLFK